MIRSFRKKRKEKFLWHETEHKRVWETSNSGESHEAALSATSRGLKTDSSENVLAAQLTEFSTLHDDQVKSK